MTKIAGGLIAMALLGVISSPVGAGDTCATFYEDGELDGLNGWWEKLGIARYTGNEAHKNLIEYTEHALDVIKDEYPELGITVQRQEQYFTRWEGGQPSIDGDITSVFSVPYSGLTHYEGVSGPMFYGGRHGTMLQVLLWPRHFRNDIHGGKIVVVKIKPVPMKVFLRLQARRSLPFRKYFTLNRYRRAISLEVQVPSLRDARLAGVKGLIVVLSDLEIPKNQYVPFTRALEGIPAVYVYGQRGKDLIQDAMKGKNVTLHNPGRITKDVSTAHLIAKLPASDGKDCMARPGAIVVNTHTDGPNRFEDNGVIALWSLMRYFAKQTCRPRDLVFVFATAHFAHEPGSTDDVVRRNPKLFANTRAALTIEHLGAQRWSEDPKASRKTEPGLFFRTAHDDSLNHMANTVLKRHIRAESQLSPMFLIKPKYFVYGEGPHLEQEGIPTLGYLSNPAYLLSRENDIHSEFFSPDLMCKQMHLFRDLIQEMMGLEPLN